MHDFQAGRLLEPGLIFCYLEMAGRGRGGARGRGRGAVPPSVANSLYNNFGDRTGTANNMNSSSTALFTKPSEPGQKFPVQHFYCLKMPLLTFNRRI